MLVAYNNNSSATTFTATWNSTESFSYTLSSHATVTFTKTPQNAAEQIVAPAVRPTAPSRSSGTARR
ncbi:glycoside hydrolase family 30 beta sandwich domain-containing protein [Streptomyces bobili]|uniref:glycoside hydrolase family 30 beta sandwich domain-containing protein n=1 Tax=Streptomyces bobili TaxID=67280 RepID=UPI00365D7E5B